jgi:hypothetical protein
MCLLFLGIRFGAETSFPPRLNMLSISIRSVYDSGLLRSRYVMIMCTYKCKKITNSLDGFPPPRQRALFHQESSGNRPVPVLGPTTCIP